jgi:hypothetical protein
MTDTTEPKKPARRPPGRPPRPRSDLVPTPGQKGLVRARSAATAEAKKVFLKALAEFGSIAAAARACDRASRTVHEWRDRDAAFAEAWDEALQIAVGKLEKEAWRRAVDGVPEPLVSGGKILGTVQRYSDSLMKTLLAAHAPEKYAKPGATVAVQMNTKGPSHFTIRFEGDGLGPMGRNEDALFDADGKMIEGDAEDVGEGDCDGDAGE